MNAFSRKIPFLAGAWLCLLSVPSPAFAATGSYVAGRSVLTIDGASAGFVKQWLGGEPIADVVAESSVAGASPKKHLGPVRYAPITVKLSFPVPAPLLSLINDFLANGSVVKTITLTDLNFDNAVVGLPLEAVDAALTEVNFEAFDAGGGKDPTFFTLVFSSALVRAAAAATLPAGLTTTTTSTKVVTSAGFAFQLGTLPTTQVSQVSAFTAKRRFAGAGPGLLPVEFSNLTVTLAESQSADWKTWAQNFIVTGNNGDAQEKTATLVIRDQLLSPVLALQFSNVGIARLRRNNPESGSETVRRVEAELYYERLTATVPLVAVTTMTPSIANAAPAATAPSTTTPATNTSPGLTPVTTVGNTVALAGVSPAPTAAITSADQGAQDPADFPRPADFTRKTFTSLRRPASSEETATYSSKSTFDEILSTYERTLKGDGWEQTMRNESGDPASGSHQFRLRWTRKLEGVEIRLTQGRAGGTEVSVALSSTRAGSLPFPKIPPAGVKPIATASGGTTGDLGARDPADFPRPAGTTRKSYTALGTATAPQETVAYTAKIPIAQVEAFYVGSLAGSDWEETFRREAGDPAAGSHQITLNWSKDRRTAAITLTESTVGTTAIDATVITPQ
ncbi:MAG: hypothetical protein ABIO94_13660 [Opitutaceae bacterium]